MANIILNKWENGAEVRVMIDEYGRLDLLKNPVKLSENDFTLLENLIKEVGNKGALSKRYGIQRYNSNALSSASMVNLFELKLNDGYYLFAKDNTGASTSILKYCVSPYTGAWTTLSSSEYNGYYRYCQFKNNIYITNRVNSADNGLKDNRVWLLNSGLFAHGALPVEISRTALTDSATTGNMATGGYAYIITNLYDDYQESSAFNHSFVAVTSAADIDLPNVAGTRIKARKIYRSKIIDASYRVIIAEDNLGEEVWTPPLDNMYLVATDSDLSAHTYTDIKSDDELGVPVSVNSLFDQKRPFKAKLSTVAKNRLIQANLEDSTLSYSAITSGDILLTSSAGSGTLTPSAEYKFRVYKAYASHSGDRNVYIVGEYTEKSITLGALHDTANITFANLSSNFDDWCDLVYVERTIGNGSEFYPFVVMRKNDAYDVYESDITFPAIAGTIDVDIIRISSFSGNSDVPESRISNTKYKNAIAYSDVNTGDLFPAENIKIIDSQDSKGITGIYTEHNRVTIFTSSNIYSLYTNTISPDYWDVTKAVNGIGASGQDSFPNTETTGHNGIQQLPNSAGYIFFNRAYSASSQNQIKAYYWNGATDSPPVVISDEIYSLIGGSSFTIHGMCYDHINNWVWVSCKTSNHQILIYDITNTCWYVFKFINSAIKFYDIICTENGKIILSGDSGYIYYYATDIGASTRYSDKYYYSALLNTDTIQSKLQTKTFDFLDADTIAVRFGILVDTYVSSAVASQLVVGTIGSETPSSITTAVGYIHKAETRFNIKSNRFYFRWENNESLGIILQGVYMDFKEVHKLSAGT